MKRCLIDVLVTLALTATATPTLPEEAKFLAHKQGSAQQKVSDHFTTVSYKQEVKGRNCGLQAHGVYMSTTDDAAMCKSKCSTDKACLSYTTYASSKCAVKCLHYTHTCDKTHQAPTECLGEIVSYSKVEQFHLPEVNRSKPVSEDATVIKQAAPEIVKSMATAASSKSKSMPSSAPSTGKKVSSVAPSNPTKMTSSQSHATSTKATPKANTKAAPKSALAPATKVPAKAASKPIEKKATPIEKKPAAAKVSKTTGTAVTEKTQPIKAVSHQAETIQPVKTATETTDTAVVKHVPSTKHASWKDYLPNNSAAKGMVSMNATSSKGFANTVHVAAVNRTDVRAPGIAAPVANMTAHNGKTPSDATPAQCACVHRHGKQVCQCVGDAAKKREQASAIKSNRSHGPSNQHSKFHGLR